MELELIRNKIYEIRGQQVMLDFDLAEIYGAETRILKRAVRSNIERFPSDFMFELTKEEAKQLINNGVSSFRIPTNYNFSAYPPFAFTEQGVAMLTSVLKSKTAIEINIQIMRAFVFMRKYILENNTSNKELSELKSQVRFLQEDIEGLSKDHEGYEQHFDDIYLALAQLAEKQKQINKPRNPIGFKKE